MKSARYIVVEGPIGVGKTTLARLLAEELNARVVAIHRYSHSVSPCRYEKPPAFSRKERRTSEARPWLSAFLTCAAQ